MNEYYKQPVVVFGVVAPLLGLIVLLAVGFNYRSKFETTYTVRKEQYAEYKKITKQREALEGKIRDQDPHMKRWMALYEQSTSANVNTLLNNVQKRFSNNEFQQTSFRQSGATGGIGGASKQPAVKLQLAFRGTYTGVQSALVEMETTMPHLQMDAMKLRQEANRGLLNAEVTYTAWQKE